MYPFRFFLSYSREDKRLAKSIVAIFKRLGLTGLWDRSIDPGRPFTEELKTLISFSHVFVPLLTPNSMRRPPSL